MLDMASTGIKRYTRLTNKLKQKYSLFSKLSLALGGACEVEKKTILFMTRENQHIQKINIYFEEK